MKTRIATLVVVLGVFFLNIACANEPIPASKAVSKSVAELIQKEMTYPDFAREDDFQCCVLIKVLINNDGSFSVDCANCKNEQLKKHVIEAVEKIISKEHIYFAGNSVNVKVNFKLLNM